MTAVGARVANAETGTEAQTVAGTVDRQLARPGEVVREHLRGLRDAAHATELHAEHLEQWGLELARRLRHGHRLLVAGNGGSAAEAQHLTAELVGRYRGDRQAFSAIALSAETSSLTALGNDYGYAQVFARQVQAHARSGDLLLLLSTSGSSENLLRAASAARDIGATSWALTGAGPNPLTEVADDAICLDAPPPHVQECQLAAIHALCEVFDGVVRGQEERRGTR
ncbi:D-sedoheptulose-7-phosphate isomerase [Pseudoclavibacter terrae]|uniref:D-sedoheptulose-7-phosphate isomerase n=1 Tax=Pseudoclavibacter terrae TaxID=1530195 RepID=UPI00232EED28|nr:SIS domain-containing protein [Pseudoclavibacter terrae]